MFLVSNDGVDVRMSDGRLFHARGPATANAKWCDSIAYADDMSSSYLPQGGGNLMLLVCHSVNEITHERVYGCRPNRVKGKGKCIYIAHFL